MQHGAFFILAVENWTADFRVRTKNATSWPSARDWHVTNGNSEEYVILENLWNGPTLSSRVEKISFGQLNNSLALIERLCNSMCNEPTLYRVCFPYWKSIVLKFFVLCRNYFSELIICERLERCSVRNIRRCNYSLWGEVYNYLIDVQGRCIVVGNLLPN